MSVNLIYGFGSTQVFHRDDAEDVLFWGAHALNVDGDGSPRCYGPTGTDCLDFLANAGHSGNWWGIYAPDNRPHVQGDSDPYPGLYVATTSLEDGEWPESDPRHWCNSETVPFFVLPGKPGPHLGAKLADLGMSFNLKNGKSSWWIFADVGPSFQLGEASIALHQALGLVPSDWPLKRYVREGGSEKVIVSILFRNSGIGWPVPNEQLAAAADQAFSQWGGLSELQARMSGLDWSQFSTA
jgi:hypothetical protein